MSRSYHKRHSHQYMHVCLCVSCLSLLYFRVGTLIAAFGQCLLLTCLCCSFDPKAKHIHSTFALFNSTGLAAMFVCVVFSLFVQSVSMQWFGDKKGFFATAGPLLSGQAVLSSCLEMAGRIPRFQASTDYVQCSGSTCVSVVLISVGGAMMWLKNDKRLRLSTLPNRNQL